MEFKVRDGNVDVAILSGPRLSLWPTQGARVLSRHCADAGLRVGWYGGSGMNVRGVIPLEGSGGVVMVEDAQKRLHRITSKAVVKIVPELNLPLPFTGWYSPGLVPESAAKKLLAQGKLNWNPIVVILGSGNRALRLGAELMQSKTANRVVCVESVYDHVQGWEVERRRYEILGGKIIFGKLMQLVQKSPFLWELKVQDENGTRVLDAARIISVGPFDEDAGFREYPPGSHLIEWENTEVDALNQDVEHVLLDEHRAMILAGRLIKGLKEQTSEFKSQLDKNIWQSKQKLRELETLDEHRFKWSFDGKWLSSESKLKLTEFPGTLKKPTAGKTLASIECIEAIGCRVCEKACPTGAIKIEREPKGGTKQFLLEDLCTGCGFCLQACPSQVPMMFEGDVAESYSTLIFPYREKSPIKKGDRIGLLNRKGDVLVTSKVLDQFLDGEVPLYKFEVPSHLAWDVRGVIPITQAPPDGTVTELYEEGGNRVEVQIQGDVRRVREGQLVSVALFEIGMSRPNDILICEDGSCGLCQIEVDGVRTLACTSKIHQGMAIRFTRVHGPSSHLCPCSEVSTDDLRTKCEATRPDSLEALTQLSEAAQGRCHGLLCKQAWMRVARDSGVQTQGYAEWMFPWMDWVFK